MAPKDFKELEDMIEFAVNLNKPVAIRYPRGGENKQTEFTYSKIELGNAEILKEGTDVTIVAIGKMVAKAQIVAENLKELGIKVELINARFLKPFDEKTITKSVKKTKIAVTIEDGTLEGGLYIKLLETLNKNDVYKKVIAFGYPDKFIKHGLVEEIEKKYGLDEENIIRTISQILAINNS